MLVHSRPRTPRNSPLQDPPSEGVTQTLTQYVDMMRQAHVVPCAATLAHHLLKAATDLPDLAKGICWLESKHHVNPEHRVSNERYRYHRGPLLNVLLVERAGDLCKRFGPSAVADTLAALKKRRPNTTFALAGL